MKSLVLALPAAARPSWVAALWQREPRLALFGLLLLAAMLPAAIALGIDERMLRGVSVWVKPLKFMASIALLALTSAWFIGYLPPERRRSRAMNAIVWTVIAAGAFEAIYITLQGALGQASHYNEGDALHATMYTLMGIGALALTGTQPALAWQVYRYGERTLAPAYRLAVLTGLTLTFVLGAGAGMLLSQMQPPAGAGLPIVGWSMSGGDLRVAHFVGIHAEQVLPALAALGVALRLPAARAWVVIIALAWSLLFAMLMVQALSGRPFISAA